MKGTNIGFINGPRYVEFEDHEAGYYDYSDRGLAKDRAINDEVQFDSTDRTELALCWFEFCRENKIITYVEEVEVAD